MLTTARFAAVLVAAALSAPAAAFADTNISAAGSTALQPLVTAAAGEYQAKHPDTKISVTGGGSRTGLGLVASKAVDLGDSDILAQNQPNLIDHRVAVIGFAIVTNPDVGVKNLSKKQIQDIFSGSAKNWKDVGGKDEQITVINRPASSGTRAVFMKTLMGGANLDQATLTEDATGTVVQKVKQTAGSVSYAAFSGTRNQSGITEVSIDGAAPTDANIQSGKYPYWSYEHVYTNGQPSKQASDFIGFLKNNKGLLQKTGYIPVGDMKVTENDR
ncbi:MAG: phosphate ABC transporter substrate-binding protein [Candidatus Eremiobacteraeota bacterium]|nr:phosphate ABC transporter substrate-binding protein [Candidatus Eremiobacteraeota bacterium]MBC5801964.1 phosphate ABC transporter substrate-binding protein [Candidatus Eremiobacteraeota bacterium]MBC5821884.1 phosphate ABC transporter substrate-binding protein [Candidatus Eremiobacteraeota bacterium]